MLGAIIGDIVGSRFEWNNIKTKEFEFFTKDCFFTDDTVMTCAVAKAVLEHRLDNVFISETAVKYMQEFGRKYSNRGYGGSFKHWIYSNNPKPYNSWGNGAAMRISACGWVFPSIRSVIKTSRLVTEVTHNHPEGIKGAEAVAVAIYLARTGKSMQEIKEDMKHYYNINFTLDEIRDSYEFDVSCQGTVPVALEAFFESTNFEDAIRNAISIGGDSDTIAAITGSIAEAYYGIPINLRNIVLKDYLPEHLSNIIISFERKFPPKIIYNNDNQNDKL